MNSPNILIKKRQTELSWSGLQAARTVVKLREFGSPTAAKMWILPNAEIVPLNRWHWSWLKTNLDVARKFGMEARVKEIHGNIEQEGRIVALNRIHPNQLRAPARRSDNRGLPEILEGICAGGNLHARGR